MNTQGEPTISDVLWANLRNRSFTIASSHTRLYWISWQQPYRALFPPPHALNAPRCNARAYAVVPGKCTADERLDRFAPSIRPVDTKYLFKDRVAPVEWWRGWKCVVRG